MPGVPLTDFGDYTNHLLAHYKDRPAVQAAAAKQNYIVVDDWISKHKYSVQGGNQIEYRVLLGHDGSARMVDIMQPTVRNYVEKVQKASAPWVIAEGTVTWDEALASFFSTDAELIDYMQTRWFLGVQSHIDLLEEQGFAVPDDANDTKNARGVPYWVNFLDSGVTDYTGGFNGKTAIWGDGTTTTNIGGIDKSTETMWRNWACNYSGTVDASLLDAIELSLHFTNFKLPKDVQQYSSKNPNVQRRIFSGITHAAQYQRLRNMGNDDRNGDVRPFGFLGNKTFSGVEWNGMASLEARTYSPIYVLDMPNFFPFVKTGWYMRRTKALNSREQPLTYSSFLYTHFNFACQMPRNQAVFHTAF